MRKVVYLIIVLLLIIGCKTQKKNFVRTERYFPDSGFFENTANTSPIALDTVENYGQLLDAMDRIVCNEKAPILLFSDEKFNYNLRGFKECSQSREVADYFRRNEIWVENDSIFFDFDNKSSITNFKEALRIIISQSLSYQLEDSLTLKPALIFFYADSDNSNEKVKDNLIRIITGFENLKSTEDVNFPFHILFQRNKFPPPPPPFFD